jgi:hypothetical protein
MNYYQQHKEERLAYQRQYNTSKRSQYASYQLSYYHNNKENEQYQETRRRARLKFYNKKHYKTVENRQIKKATALKLKMLKELEKKFKKMTFYEPEPEQEPEPEPLEDVPFKDFKINSRGLFYLEW